MISFDDKQKKLINSWHNLSVQSEDIELDHNINLSNDSQDINTVNKK